MKRTYKYLLIIISIVFSMQTLATQINRVSAIRVWADPDKTRIVMDVNSNIKHKIFKLKSPNRLVIDLKDTKIKRSVISQSNNNKGLLKGIRGAAKKDGYRVVLDLKKNLKVSSFFLKPNKKYGNRLVIDLFANSKSTTEKMVVKSTKSIKTKKDFVIIIDPGHGGEDPGAIGPKKTREKDVVLATAKKLAKKINAAKGFKAYLTRDGDYYISLRKRINLARKKQADLFISLHADAFRNSKVKGASVYTLSQRGASSEAAKWLASKENSSDLVGGVSLNDKDDVLASVLLSLSQTGTNNASKKLGNIIFKELGKKVILHNNKVENAGFVVLKAPDIPSILIELGYISNPKEEKNLKNSKHQNKLAVAINNGIKKYYDEYSKTALLRKTPAYPNKNNKNKKHTVSKGETLSLIAKKYNTSIDKIIKVNDLQDSQIRAGEKLVIPM
ncbi:MAG: AMIN domain-containing protein [Gammaproteobacteria bacterium]|nr:MAG: AMIN domain-containing protein [Gammaproteobacteria bacterium]